MCSPSSIAQSFVRSSPSRIGRNVTVRRQAALRTLSTTSSSSNLTSTSTQPEPNPHLQVLLQNPELSENDATNELRWIVSEVRSHAAKEMARGRLPPIEDERVGQLVRRRAEGEPLQYILGSTDFGPLNLLCKKPVLIPRSETAHIFTLLSQSILSSISLLSSAARPKEPLSILDLCTGSACIPLLMTHLNPLCTVVGIDNSPAAVALGNANVQKLQMSERVKVRYGNVFSDPEALLLGAQLREGGRIGMVVSNPPYIPYDQYQDLPRSVRVYESPSALLGDGLRHYEPGRGLKFYERISQVLEDLLVEEEKMVNQGWSDIPRVAVEVGLGQATEVEDILRSSKGGVVGRTEVWKDQYGSDRMVVGWSR
ncbi:hypothetical protein IAR55_002419 [Kwoniella newhampshirensis]|uniref:Release factor glutamine methyltransferase N-terminal domain-containing protein n=1 Tax=Kwoniella newhampshirensis TaxID=1651941 RepID=A0AAW0Z109_9TREE